MSSYPFCTKHSCSIRSCIDQVPPTGACVFVYLLSSLTFRMVISADTSHCVCSMVNLHTRENTSINRQTNKHSDRLDLYIRKSEKQYKPLDITSTVIVQLSYRSYCLISHLWNSDTRNWPDTKRLRAMWSWIPHTQDTAWRDIHWHADKRTEKSFFDAQTSCYLIPRQKTNLHLKSIVLEPTFKEVKGLGFFFKRVTVSVWTKF